MRSIRLFLAALIGLALFSASTAQDKPEPPPRKWTFGMIGVAMRPDLTIYQGGGKNAAGELVVTEGDRLLTWGGKDLKNLDDFCRALYRTKPGEEVEVSFERADKDTKEKKTLKATIKLGDPRVNAANLYADKNNRSRNFDWAKVVDGNSSARSRVTKEIVDAKLGDAWDNLIAAHERELDLWDCYESATACETLLRDPLAAEAFIRNVTDAMAEPCKDPLKALDPFSWRLMRLAGRDLLPGEPWVPEGGLEPIRLALYGMDWTRDGDDIIKVDPATVRDFEFAWAGQPGHDKCVATVKAMRNVERGKADFIRADRLMDIGTALVTAAGGLKKEFDETKWPTGDHDFPSSGIGGLGSAPKQRPLRGKGPKEDGAYVSWNTYYGIVAVGGYGKNSWRCTDTERFALVVDMGGDDEYIDCASTHFTPSSDNSGKGSNRVSAVIDLGGNDHYRSTGKWGVGAGVLGTAIIYDGDGDDTYECGEWGIGTAFGGVGLVIDARGNDRYLGGHNSIGCAAYGFGGVIDLAGNDVYDSHEYSIGVGHPGGVGFVLDRDGDDRYRCGGEVPSGYGTAGEYSCWGIGCGFGWRGLAAGGTGLVVDVAGNDIYDAGEFGLGCGYFLGVGMVRDMAGDDIYHSSRYGLAAAAHCAVGLFMDDKGNDTYEGKTAASMAGVWDIAVGYFHEGGGNDIYRCDGLALGASAQNGVGIFYEAGGDDVYRCGANCLGHGGAAEYAGGRLAKNFGLFFDLGGSDSYATEGRTNGKKLWNSAHGLFADD